MNEDYLWDHGGEPDPEVAHLEKVLSPLRWSQTPQASVTQKVRRRWPLWSMATAALLLAAVGAMFLWREKAPLGSPTSWRCSLANGATTALRGGQLLETGSRTAKLRSDLVGELQLEPNSRLRLLAAHAGLQRFALERGTIHAFIWAPPATFVVDTPAAKTVDLGCRYTLKVAEDGSGFLSVEMGWVAFEWRGIESFIPAGAVCSTRAAHGPGTPYFADAPPALARAVSSFDLHPGQTALHSALASARPRDALTLWHLMQRTQGDDRARVFDRYQELVPLPQTVTRNAILRGDPTATDAAWNALELGNLTWWRGWQRKW